MKVARLKCGHRKLLGDRVRLRDKMQHRAIAGLHTMRFGKVGAALTLCAMLMGCKPLHERLADQAVPFPIQDHVCDLFETTEYMREYWIGIHDGTGYPDVKVRIPYEYMDWRFGKLTRTGRLDGAIGFSTRPLDFAPNHPNLPLDRQYPDGPIDPARPAYKRAGGGLLLKQPQDMDGTAQQWLTNASRGRQPLPEIIAEGRKSDAYPDLLLVKNDGIYRRDRDVFLEVVDGRIINYFNCTKRELEVSGRILHASCRVYGNYGVVSYKHRFDLDFMPEWREQIAKVHTFIDCMQPVTELDVEKE